MTLFFQDEINVGTRYVKFRDLFIVKYLHLFGCLLSQYVVLQVSYSISLSHNASNIFSKLANSVLKYLQATFSLYLGFLLKDEHILTTDE